MASFLFWSMIIGYLLTTLSATASVVLNEIQWHELEEYCKQKKQSELFGRIFDLRDQLDLGAGIFQAAATALAVVSMVCWLNVRNPISELDGWGIAWVVGLVGFCLVFSVSWIAWAVARIGAVKFLFRTWRWWWVVSALAWPLMVGGRFVTLMFARATGQDEDCLLYTSPSPRDRG